MKYQLTMKTLMLFFVFTLLACHSKNKSEEPTAGPMPHIDRKVFDEAQDFGIGLTRRTWCQVNVDDVSVRSASVIATTFSENGELTITRYKFNSRKNFKRLIKTGTWSITHSMNSDGIELALVDDQDVETNYDVKYAVKPKELPPGLVVGEFLTQRSVCFVMRSSSRVMLNCSCDLRDLKGQRDI